MKKYASTSLSAENETVIFKQRCTFCCTLMDRVCYFKGTKKCIAETLSYITSMMAF